MNIDMFHDELCEFCTDYMDSDDHPINTNQYNMCEGIYCEDMVDRYLEDTPFTYLKFTIIVSELLEQCFIDKLLISDIKLKVNDLMFECITDGRILYSNIPVYTLVKTSFGCQFKPSDDKTIKMSNDPSFDMGEVE